MTSKFSIHLFGQPEVLTESGSTAPGLGLGKPLAVLCYLIIEGRSSREEVMDLLWGEMPEAKARNAFRQALHRLRTSLGENIIPHDPEMVFFSDSVEMATDVDRFETFLRDGDVESAISEYRGEFLSGLNLSEPAFDAWQESKRKKYRARFRDALRDLIQAALEAGDVHRALQRATMLADLDPMDSEAVMLFATTLLGAGRRAEALHALEEHARRFQDEMGSPAPQAIAEFASRLRRAPAQHGNRGGSRARAGFVGRTGEVALLLTRLKSLESGGGSLVVIEGEAGAGKTRLIDEFFIRARDIGPHLLLLGRERSPDSAIAYASLAEALRGLLDAPGIGGTGQHLLAEAGRLLPQLRDLFSLPTIGDIVDDAGRLRFYEGISALLDSAAYEQPICIALDDFQNCSSATFSLVQYLVERLRDAPILFLISGRPAPAFAQNRRRLFDSVLKTNASANREGREPALIALGSLGDDDARQLAVELAGADAESIDEIIAVSGGVPFRIVEAVDRSRSGEPFSTALVPIRDVLWSRLQRCTQPEQRLFVTVALFDRPVPIRLLAAASHLPEKSALDAALSLEREGFLRQRSEGMAPAHDFARELALEGTGPAGMALLAGWAAEALERDNSGTAAELATLFAQSGRRKEAFRYSRTAAYEAMHAGARGESVHHFETALASAPSATERDEIATMLRSLGSGVLRLPADSSGDASPAQPTGTPPSPGLGATGTSAPPEPEAVAPAASARGSDRRRSQLRMSGAIAAVLAIGLLGWKTLPRRATSSVPGTSLADTLMVARELDPRDTVIAYTTGQLGSPLRGFEGATLHGRTRTWIDSLRLPWTNPLPSPDGNRVALERITKSGSALYVISIDRRDTVRLGVRRGDDFSSGWSPDSRWILATHGETRPDGTYGSSLYAYSIVESERRISFDTSQSGVVEASWSPDGSHVAWTARIGNQHQQDIFLSDADGRNITDLSDNPAEDYSIAWSPNGHAIAFTSERSGRAELYAADIATRRVRRLTWEGAHADHAAFSPDGRWIAYESSKVGTPGVYVMPSGGGTGRSVAPALTRVSLIGWAGFRIPYVDQILVDVPGLSNPGDVGALSVHALDRNGDSIDPGAVQLDVLTPKLIRLANSAQAHESSFPPDSVQLRALGVGMARIAVSASGWRTDTAFIPIGNQPISLLTDDFERGLDRHAWNALGRPAAIVERGVGAGRSAGLVARSDRQWQSGVLSQTVFPIRRGLTAEAWVSAPFNDPASSARSFIFALVAADPAAVLDSAAPRFLRLATVSWLGEAGRLSYSVGRETFTQPLSRLGPADAHRVSITVDVDDRVSFFVDGVLRWKSSLRISTGGDNSRAQLWLGTQSTGQSVIFDDVAIRIEPGAPERARRK